MLTFKICVSGEAHSSVNDDDEKKLYNHGTYKRQMQKTKTFLSTLRPFKLKLSSECD